MVKTIKPINLLYFSGPPGCGKTYLTQAVAAQGTASACCEKISNPILNIDTSRILRNVGRMDNEIGKAVSSEIHRLKEGELFSGKITADAVVYYTNLYWELARERNGYEPICVCVAGSPRTDDELNRIMEYVGIGAVNCSFMFMDATSEQRMQGIRNRLKEEGRLDDSDESLVQKRMSIYTDNTLPVIEQLKSMANKGVITFATGHRSFSETQNVHIALGIIPETDREIARKKYAIIGNFESRIATGGHTQKTSERIVLRQGV